MINLKLKRFVIISIYLFIGISVHCQKVSSLNPTGQKEYYKDNYLKWLYIGWEGDHPKSWVFVGGALGPGQACHPGNNLKKGQIIQYVVQYDGKVYTPDVYSPGLKQRIKWYYEEGYLPCIVSEWQAGELVVSIRHFANRILNNSATAVYTRVALSNTAGKTKSVKLMVNAPEFYEVPLGIAPSFSDSSSMEFTQNIELNKTVTFDFATVADKEVPTNSIIGAGTYNENYSLMSKYYNNRISKVAHTVSLPVPDLVNMQKSMLITIWQSVVQNKDFQMVNENISTQHTTYPNDLEIRTSAYNPFALYTYDRQFSHDLTCIADYLMRAGDFELVKKVISGKYYNKLNAVYDGKNEYGDQLGQYPLPFAEYLMATNDISFFTPEVMKNLKICAKNIHNARVFTDKEFPGLLKPSRDFENRPSDILLADSWAGLHGLQSYKYICDKLREKAESDWALAEMKDLNNCINNALKTTMERKKTDYYFGAFSDSTLRNYITISWVPYSAALSTFPWGAYLKGFEFGGVWKDYFDASIKQCKNELKKINIPEGSWSTWWLEEFYGSAYVASASGQLLASEEYRTETIKSVEFLLNNQCSPFRWSEAFNNGYGDWSPTEIPPQNYSNWTNFGPSFTLMALQQACISVKTDNTVIIGRGIPNYWLKQGEKIEWGNVYVNNNKTLGFIISRKADEITLTLKGDIQDGNIIFNLPVFKNNIRTVSAGVANIGKGTVTIKPSTRSVIVKLINTDNL